MRPQAEMPFPDRASRIPLFGPLITLLGLTLRQNVHGRRGYVLAGLFLLPLGLALLIRLVDPNPQPGEIEFGLAFNLIPHALAPLTALLYASGMIQDEIEGQTLTYLLMRPLPRWALYATKLLGTFLMTSTLTAAGVAALYVVIYWGGPGFREEILLGRMPRAALVLALGQAAYCALFGALMLWFRRSLIAGVVYIVVIEAILANVPFLLRRLTVVYYERVLFLTFLDAPAHLVEDWAREWDFDLALLPDVSQCVWRLLGAAVVLAVLSMWYFSRREFALKTPEGN